LLQSRLRELIAKLQSTPAKVTWVNPQQLHWTLKFLGDTPLLDVPRICAAVTKAVADFAPIDIAAEGVGAFPDLERPRTIWVGAGEGTDELIALHAAIDGGLADIGFRPEGRRYRPHLTIGRVRGQQGLDELGRRIAEQGNFDAGLSTIYDVGVFSSELTRHGPIYEPLGHADLKG
jgi:2'-5' RNA ligase